jgi:hypothetical protein
MDSRSESSIVGVAQQRQREAIAAQLKSLEADLDDPELRSLKLSAIVELSKALERLGKSVRTDVPQWQLCG